MEQRKGLSIIEVFVAIAISGILIVFIMDISGQADANLRRTRMKIIAYCLAQEKMEEKSDWASASTGTTTENYGTISGFSDFRRICTVTNDPTNEGILGLRGINVTVYWFGRGNIETSFALNSMIADY